MDGLALVRIALVGLALVCDELGHQPLGRVSLVRLPLVGVTVVRRVLVGRSLELAAMSDPAHREVRDPERRIVTVALTVALGAAATLIALVGPTDATLAGAPAWWLGAVALLPAFAISEALMMHFEFRRQAHSLTLAGIPLVLGALLVPIQVVVVARVLGAGTTFALQRVRLDKFGYNVAAYAFEAAADAALVRILLGDRAHLDMASALVVLAVVAVVDQVMSALVVVMIKLHTTVLTRRVVLTVLVPALVMTCVSTVVAVGVVLLTGAGALGVAVVVLVTSAGLLLYRTYLGMTRRHAALALVHDFVTGSAGANSFAAAARELLPRVRALLRAGSVEMFVVSGEPGEGSVLERGGTRFVDSDSAFDAQPVPELTHDWALLRALSHGEPLLAPRTSKDRAVLGWLREHGRRDAMVVAFPASSGIKGTLLVSDRLGDTATFTHDDLTLLQTLTGHLAVASTSARMVEQLAYDANHDQLTGLANRAALVRHISEHETDHATYGAVLVMDLDRFKEVNDALGHGAGDAVLKIVGERLLRMLPGTALAARLGGDEFAVHLCGLSGADEARRIGAAVAEDLARPLSIDGAVLDAEASIGIALAAPDGDAATSTELMRRADTAMYVAKASDDRVALYDPDMDRGRAENLALLADLRTTVRTHPEQFTLYFQPKIDLRSRKVIGAEALVRWNHPTLGVLSPDRFIPLAETSGLIHQFTPLVISRALAECRRWAAHGESLSVAVNVSARNVGDATLPRQIATALDDADMPAHRLIVEITESSILADPDRALAVIGEIADLGVSISLDDFGTGYSSLSYLHRFPAREVKIDKSFVQGLDGAGSEASRALVAAIITLGHNLHLRVVAEGAETPQTLDLLAELDCDAVQGYTIARPLPAEEFLEWLRAYRASTTPVRLAHAG